MTTSITLPVTLLLASALGVMMVVVSYRIAIYRIKSRIEIGTGNDASLERLIRVQGNLIEYAPMGLILVGLLEINHIPRIALITLASLFFLARVAHAYGFGAKPGRNPGRFYGILITWLVLLVASGWGIFLVLAP